MLSQQEAKQLVAEMMVLQQSGLTTEQCRHLLAMREHARRGRYRDDSVGSPAGDLPSFRRLEYARWLYRHGRISG